MNGNNHSGLIWKILGPIVAGALLTVSVYSYQSLEKKIGVLEERIYELSGLVRGHIGLNK